MSVLIFTLKEELQTARRLEKKYYQKLSRLPQGSFIVRKKGKQNYGYLTRREKGQVVQEYLGSLEEKNILQYREKIKIKKNYKEHLKKIKEQIKILERALRGSS